MDDINLKEKEILEAARSRFAHYGFSKVTMEEIAADIGMGKASLYYYYPTKEELFKSVIHKEQDVFIGEIEKLFCRKISAENKLRNYVKKRLEYFRELINLSALNIHSFPEIKTIFKELFEDFEYKELLLLQTIFDEGKSSGEFDSRIKPDTTKIFLHLLQGLRLRIIKFVKDNRMEKENYDELREETAVLVEIFINGIKA
ncbi:MAG TPA: helix-turn-helix domain-containing protein [Ignavibacteriaceae bacterium]